MKKTIFPPEQYYITTPQLWNSLRIPPKKDNKNLLSKAIKAGRTGKDREGFAFLKEYYRLKTADKWIELKALAKENQSSDETVKKILNRDITLAHGMKVKFSDHIDFSSQQSGHDAMLWLQALGWMNPVVFYFVKTVDSLARGFLITTLNDFYASRDKVAPSVHYAWGALGYDSAISVLHNAFIALLHTGDVPNDFMEHLLKYALGAGRKIFPFVKRFILHNIHTSGCWAIFKAARFYPELKDTSQWEHVALSHLARHTYCSFYKDGCHIERCWGYGWHTLNRLTNAYYFAQKTGGIGKYKKKFLSNLKRNYEWFAKTISPDYMTPGYGDDTPLPAKPIIAAGEKLFPGFSKIVRKYLEKSSFEPASGFAFFKNKSVYANITFGEYAGWHSHFDSLNFNLHFEATPLLVELSRFGSYGHPLDHIFRSPEAHNQMLVDGHPYDNRFQPACGNVIWKSTPTVDYFSATHRAYRRAVDPEGMSHRCYVAAEDLIVRRTILFIKNPGYFVIMDSVRYPDPEKPFTRAVSGWWHSPTPFKVCKTNSAVITGETTGCLLLWMHPETIRRIDTGWDFDSSVECAGNRKSYSLRVRSWTTQTSLNINGLTTIIIPFHGKMPKITTELINPPNGKFYRAEAIQININNRKDQIILNPEKINGFKVGDRKISCCAEITLGNMTQPVRIQ